MSFDAAVLPTLNAVLNCCCAVCLLAGYTLIRTGRRRGHRLCMTLALALSGAFLVSYLVHHSLWGSTRFQGEGLARAVYLGILVSHSALAAANVPLVLLTLARALRSRHAAHRRLARWALPVWGYVSVTGVVVYWMLYRL